MLHELMGLDPDNRCPTTYECLSPNHFLLSESWVRRLAWWILPRNRPFDNMRMSFDRPQEDEAALCLRGQPGSFLTVAFPRRPVQDQPYITLEELNERQLSNWQARMRKFLKLLLYKKQGQLVLKSPQHTFRLPKLQEMFPQAKFIFLVRDPLVIYPSTMHFWKTMYETYGLQGYDEGALSEYVLSTFEQMHLRIEATKSEIAVERFYSLRYEDLVEDPVGQLELIYKKLDLGNYEKVRPAIEKYAERSQRYQTNRYTLDAATQEVVRQRWSTFFQLYGYETVSTPV